MPKNKRINKRINKRDAYRRLLERVFYLIERRGNYEDILCGNSSTLFISQGVDIVFLRKKFQEIKKNA